MILSARTQLKRYVLRAMGESVEDEIHYVWTVGSRQASSQSCSLANLYDIVVNEIRLALSTSSSSHNSRNWILQEP